MLLAQIMDSYFITQGIARILLGVKEEFWMSGGVICEVEVEFQFQHNVSRERLKVGVTNVFRYINLTMVNGSALYTYRFKSVIITEILMIN